MSQASDRLVEKYKTQIHTLIDRATQLKQTIDSAKTSTKKNFYKKKLVKTNKQCAHLVIKLDKLLKIKSEDKE